MKTNNKPSQLALAGGTTPREEEAGNAAGPLKRRVQQEARRLDRFGRFGRDDRRAVADPTPPGLSQARRD